MGYFNYFSYFRVKHGLDFRIESASRQKMSAVIICDSTLHATRAGMTGNKALGKNRSKQLCKCECVKCAVQIKVGWNERSIKFCDQETRILPAVIQLPTNRS